MAVRTFILDLSGSMTPWTGHVELHATTRLRNLPGPFTFRTGLSRPDRGGPLANWTDILARNVQTQNGATNRLPKSYIHLIFEIGSRFGTLRFRPFTTREDVGKDIAESAARLLTSGTAAGEIGKVKTTKIEWDTSPGGSGAARVCPCSSRESPRARGATSS